MGDYCSLNLPSDIKIFDGKIERKKIKIPSQWKRNSIEVANPAGTIQKEAWPILKKAIKDKENIFVDGGEDLLVIPSVLLSPKKWLWFMVYSKRGFV